MREASPCGVDGLGWALEVTAPIDTENLLSRSLLDTLPRPHDDVQQPRSWGTVMDVVVWLRSPGLGKYDAAFRENEIDETVLPNLT